MAGRILLLLALTAAASAQTFPTGVIGEPKVDVGLAEFIQVDGLGGVAADREIVFPTWGGGAGLQVSDTTGLINTSGNPSDGIAYMRVLANKYTMVFVSSYRDGTLPTEYDLARRGKFKSGSSYVSIAPPGGAFPNVWLPAGGSGGQQFFAAPGTSEFWMRARLEWPAGTPAGSVTESRLIVTVMGHQLTAF